MKKTTYQVVLPTKSKPEVCSSKKQAREFQNSLSEDSSIFEVAVFVDEKLNTSYRESGE